MFLISRKSGSFGRAKSAIAAIEFALIAPMLFLMTAGVFDAAKALILRHQVRNTAHVIAVSATNISVNLDQTTTLTDAEAQQAMSLIYAEMPWVRSGVETGARSVTITSIAFKPNSGCTVSAGQNCYTPNVAFSVPYNGGNQGGTLWNAPPSRACGTVAQISSTAAIPVGQTQQTVLRTANIAKPDAMLVVDVHYIYTPFFWKFVTGPVSFWATDMQPVRTFSTSTEIASAKQFTNYSGINGTGNCPNL